MNHMEGLGFTAHEQEVLLRAVKPDVISKMTAEHYYAALWILRGRGNGALDSAAGSGKTWFGIKVAVPLILASGVQECAYACFGKRNAEELAEKLKADGLVGCAARTIHSLAFGAVKVRHSKGKMAMDREPTDGKYRQICKDLIADLASAGASASLQELIEAGELDLLGPAEELCDLVRSQLREPTDENLQSMASWFGVVLPPGGEPEQILFRLVRKVLEIGFNQIPVVWDFADLLWKCAKSNYRPKQFPWLVVDEYQDLSPAQLKVAELCMMRGARILFIGDPDQAIMGFAGADHRSCEAIVKKMECEVMGLSVCWRCPTSHLDLARQIVPKIQNAPGAILGEIYRIAYEKLAEQVREGDMIICRVNADLISLCFALIRAKVPARVIGRKIGEGLVAIAKQISKRKDFHGWEVFDKDVSAWIQRAVSSLLRKNGEDNKDPAIEMLRDKGECLRIIWEMDNCRTLKQFEVSVNSLFSDDRPAVALSSIHRAKGLEADRVYILREDLLPGPWAVPGTWQYKQEENLHYVALTRAKQVMTFVAKPQKG